MQHGSLSFLTLARFFPFPSVEPVPHLRFFRFWKPAKDLCTHFYKESYCVHNSPFFASVCCPCARFIFSIFPYLCNPPLCGTTLFGDPLFYPLFFPLILQNLKALAQHWQGSQYPRIKSNLFSPITVSLLCWVPHHMIKTTSWAFFLSLQVFFTFARQFHLLLFSKWHNQDPLFWLDPQKHRSSHSQTSSCRTSLPFPLPVQIFFPLHVYSIQVTKFPLR